MLQAHLPWSGSVYWDAGAGSNYDRISRAVTESAHRDSWNHWTFVKDSKAGTMSIYYNGSLWHSGSGHTRDFNEAAKEFRLGSTGSGSEKYRGAIDEFWVANVARSPAWIKAAYDNQKTPESFVTSGAKKILVYDCSDATGIQVETGGAWSTRHNLWSDLYGDGNELVAWSPGAQAIFQEDGNVTVSALNILAHSLTFSGTGYTLAGNRLELSAGLTAHASATIKVPVTLLQPQEWFVAQDQTVTLDGPGWNIAHTLTKTGPGILRFINHNYSQCGAELDIVVAEGEVRFDTGYWWSWDTTDAMRILVQSGARLSTARATFGYLPQPHAGSLQQVLLEEDATWTLADNISLVHGLYQGGGRIIMQGATIEGGTIHPLYNGLPIETRPSETVSLITSALQGYEGSDKWQLIVADGAAEPDLRIEGVLRPNVTGIQKLGAGCLEWCADNLHGNTTISEGTLWVNNTVGSGTGTGTVLIDGGTLGGTGIITNSIVFGGNGGTLAPGMEAATGTLTLNGNTVFAENSLTPNTLAVTLHSAGDYSSIQVGGDGVLDLNGATLDARLTSKAQATTFYILTVAEQGQIVGTFKGLPEGKTVKLGPDGERFVIHYQADKVTGQLIGGHDVALRWLSSGTVLLIK